MSTKTICVILIVQRLTWHFFLCFSEILAKNEYSGNKFLIHCHTIYFFFFYMWCTTKHVRVKVITYTLILKIISKQITCNSIVAKYSRIVLLILTTRKEKSPLSSGRCTCTVEKFEILALLMNKIKIKFWNK